MQTLRECPPGLFLFDGTTFGFKSEYKTESQSRPGVWQSDAYVLESGEYFWGGTSDPVAREKLLVMPVVMGSPDPDKDADDFEAELSVTKTIYERRLKIASRDAEIAEAARREARTGRCPDCGANYATMREPPPGRVEFDPKEVGFTLDQEPTPDPERRFPKNAVD